MKLVAELPSRQILSCIEDLNALFAKRPIYARSILVHQVGQGNTKFLKRYDPWRCYRPWLGQIWDVYFVCRALPFVAYSFTDGPWRKLWIRFGYDPREHPEAAMCVFKPICCICFSKRLLIWTLDTKFLTFV